jgi:O-antigen/teichoic acid export membrane protein
MGNFIKDYLSIHLIKKYFKKNFSDSAYGILNLFVASLDGFFLNILLVRFLTLTDLGNYKIFFSVVNILIIFSINGLNASVTKAVAKNYKAFFIKATKLSTLTSLFASLVMIILAFTYYGNSDIKYVLIYSSLFIPVYFGFNIWESYLYGVKQFKTILLFNAIVAAVRFGACSLILFYYKNYLYTVIVYLFIVSAFNIIFYFWIYKKIKHEKIEKEDEKALIKHGFRLTGASTVSVIASNIERIILDAASNAATVGIYSIISIFPTFIKNGLKNIVNVPTVKLAAYSEKENRIIIKKGLILIFLSGLVIFGIFWFVTPYLLRFFFKIADPAIITFGQLALIPIIFVPTNLTIKYMCSYQGSGSSILKLNTVLDSMKVALLAIFIPFFKINGIIIALILAEFLAFIILIVWFVRSNRRFDIK